MRRRSARRDAAIASGLLLDLDALLTTLRGVHGLGIGLVDLERLAVRRRELAVERLDRLLQALHGVIAESLGLADLVVDAALAAGDELEELALEPPDLRHRDLVQLAGGAQPQRDDLALHRVRRVLALLEQLHEALAALQSGAAGGVEVGGERREGLQLAELGEVQTEPACDRLHGLDLRGTTDAGHRDADVDGRADT